MTDETNINPNEKEEISMENSNTSAKDMADKLRKRVAIIGVGNCGGQIAMLAENKYPELFDSVYINTSENDLAMIKSPNGEKYKYKIGKHIEGSAKDRSRMKEYLQANLNRILSNEEFRNVMSTKQYCYVIASAAGGTGSGASPVLLDILRQLFPDITFVLVVVLPQLSASLLEQGNAVEYLKELYDILGSTTTYMIYDNETTSGMSSTQSLVEVNENIVEDLRVLTGIDNHATPYDSIDPADMESIIKTPGRLMVTRVNKNLTEKTLEDNKLDDIIIKAIKSSCHAETDRNKRVIMWGVITYFTEAVNKLYSSELSGVCDFIGTPIQRFNHNAINTAHENLNFLYLITAGLSPINDRVKKITERIEELEKALASDNTNKFILSGDGAAFDVTNARGKINGDNKSDDKEINVNDIFSRYMNKN